jgi:hypothetical protein
MHYFGTLNPSVIFLNSVWPSECLKQKLSDQNSRTPVHHANPKPFRSVNSVPLPRDLNGPQSSHLSERNPSHVIIFLDYVIRRPTYRHQVVFFHQPVSDSKSLISVQKICCNIMQIFFFFFFFFFFFLYRVPAATAPGMYRSLQD